MKDSQDARDFQAYLDSYPNGIFNRLARVRIAALGDTAAKPRAHSPAAELNSAPMIPAGDYEALLKQNWRKIEAALKTHMQTEYSTYRHVMPGNTMTTMRYDLKLTYVRARFARRRARVFRLPPRR